MPVLKLGDSKKVSKSGDYQFETRLSIFNLKIKEEKTFKLGDKGEGGDIYGIKVTKETWPYEMTYSKTLGGKKESGSIKATQIFKDKDFGGGGGSGGGSSKTEIVESLQCYYLSMLYNSNLSELTMENCSICDSKKNTKNPLYKYEKYCDTTVKLSECLKQDEWGVEVYIKIANAIYKSNDGKRFKGLVYFHRGSKFMDRVYARRKRCMDHDKKLAKEPGISVKAPSSFSNDKWNPGDIWMSTLSPSDKDPFPDSQDIWEGKLGKNTCDWGALQTAVLTSAKLGITMGVSLKKVGTNDRAKVDVYNNYNVDRGDIRLLGYTFGNNGDFFSSTDMYLHFSNGSKIQLRSFDGTTSWQGEIKGGAAAGGKIGGGGVNYYSEKHFGKTIGKGVRVTKNSHNWAETKSPNLRNMYRLYKIFLKYQLVNTNQTPIDTLEDFITSCESYTNQNKPAGPSFTFSKNMCLLLLQSIGKGNSIIGGNFGQDIFRYAASNTDFSSFFIKVS